MILHPVYRFSHVVNDLAFSANGEQLLVASGHAQIRVLDRQGKQWAETIRGSYANILSFYDGHLFLPIGFDWYSSTVSTGTHLALKLSRYPARRQSSIYFTIVDVKALAVGIVDSL